MAGTNKSKENTNTSTHAAISDVHDIESSYGLLPIATLGVSSDVTSLLTLVLCDSASTHSWVSSSLVNRLRLVREPVNLSISGFHSTTVVETQRVKFTVSSEPIISDFVFSECAFVRDNFPIGSELINIADLQDKNPQLAPIKHTQYTCEDVEIIIGQNYYHAVRPIEFILGDDKNSPCSVRLPIGWVISGPLPPSVHSTSSCLKCLVEDSSLTGQIKSWYELESYGAFKQVELHMFGDSSQDVFCAVGFLRARLSSSHKTQISFIFGKARVAPMKALSIPKLELQAALLATRLKDDILTALTVSVNHVYMWTDKTTVLQWLNSTEKLPVFIANRVG